MTMEEYYVSEAKCTDKTKKGVKVDEIARPFDNAIVELTDIFTKEEFEVKLRTMIAKETAAFKGATIDVHMSQYGDIIWYTFTKNKADVGCILMKRIKKHITEL